MNQTENERLEGELKFTESMNDLRKKLLNLSCDSPSRKVSRVGGQDKSVQKSSSFQSIQQVASQGVNTTQATNHVEHFLSGGKLPNIQGNITPVRGRGVELFNLHTLFLFQERQKSHQAACYSVSRTPQP